MRVTIVGSGTVVPDPERVCSSYYVETGGVHILLDCGPGAVHHLARFGLPWGELTHIALSHFHTDHVGGLPFLLFALRYALREPRKEPLTVVGPFGMLGFAERLAAAFGGHVLDPGFPVRYRDLTPGEPFELDAGVSLRAHATPHTETSVAYRLESPSRSLGYTGDTGSSDELGAFLAGVDLLIAECSLPDAAAIETHLSPSRVAELARSAQPRRLVLTHVYPELQAQDLVALVRAGGWEGETVIARDGLTFTV